MEYLGIEPSIKPADERNAIVEFLDRYWDVRMKDKKPIGKAVDYVLRKGIEFGIAVRERDIGNRLGMEEDVLGYRLGNQGFRKTVRAVYGYEFAPAAEAAEENLKRNWMVSAAPKGFKKYKRTHRSEEFSDPPNEREFNGSDLYHSMAVCTPGFSDFLRPENVFYEEDQRDRGPLNALTAAIFRQGMTIGMRVVDEKWGEEEVPSREEMYDVLKDFYDAKWLRNFFGEDMEKSKAQ